MTLTEIRDDLSQHKVATTKAETIRGLHLELARVADKRYGKGGWKRRKDRSITGYYVVATDGRCLVCE